MTMPAFVFDQIVEVHRDPGGHYHHWSILVGTLQQGSLSMGQILSIPTIDGTPCSARIGGFEAFRRVLPSTLHAQEHNFPVGMMLWTPAPPQTLIGQGTAHPISEEQHQQNLRALLLAHPEAFFHHQGKTAFLCTECVRVLLNFEDKEHLLQLLLERWTEPFLQEQARRWLGKRKD